MQELINALKEEFNKTLMTYIMPTTFERGFNLELEKRELRGELNGLNRALNLAGISEEEVKAMIKKAHAEKAAILAKAKEKEQEFEDLGNSMSAKAGELPL